MALAFQSPRFAGDAFLEDVLNDPDTGTKQVKKNSPVASVEAVQQAIFDLGIPQNYLEPPVVDETTFVDGDYGSATTNAVQAYKKLNRIYFPPDGPIYSGATDGLAGPRTLRKLDGHCVLFDEATTEINAKAADLTASGVQAQVTDPLPTVVGRTPGAFSNAEIDGVDGGIWYRRGIGAFEVHGNILLKYIDLHHARAGEALGFPINDEHDDGPGFRASDFEYGTLRCDLSSGVVDVLLNNSGITGVTF
jgi:peptidoglycan hydrolase-like protein with peptidoglycan-binding domain